MSFFSGKTKKITTGGEFIRGIKGEGEQARGIVQTALDAAKQPFQAYDVDKRFADFTPDELQAMQQQRGLAALSPEAAQERLADLTALRQAATMGVTSADVAAQREMLAGTAEAEKMAAQQALRGALRDIGSAAGGMGVGQLTGARADILRGGAAADFAQTMAGIEGQLQRQSVSGARQSLADRLQSGAALIGQEAGMERDIYGQQLAQSQLLGDVGLRERQLEQQRRDFTFGEAMREEESPFLQAQRATSAIGGLAGLMTPQQTQLIKKKSGLQQAAGLGLMAAGVMSAPATGGASLSVASKGADLAAKTGGGIASLAMGGAPTNYRQVLGYYRKPTVKTELAATGKIPMEKSRMTKDGDFRLDDDTIISGDTGFERGIKDRKTGKDIADTPVKVEEQKQGMSFDDRAALISKGTSMLEDEIIDTGPAQLSPAQQAARARYMGQYEEGGGILNRIVEGARTAYQKFKDIPSEDKIKYGLALLATEPASPYESSSTTFARGLLGGQELIAQAEEREIDRMKAEAATSVAKKGASLADFDRIYTEIFGTARTKAGTGGKLTASQNLALRELAQKEGREKYPTNSAERTMYEQEKYRQFLTAVETGEATADELLDIKTKLAGGNSGASGTSGAGIGSQLTTQQAANAVQALKRNP